MHPGRGSEYDRPNPDGGTPQLRTAILGFVDADRNDHRLSSKRLPILEDNSASAAEAAAQFKALAEIYKMLTFLQISFLFVLNRKISEIIAVAN